MLATRRRQRPRAGTSRSASLICEHSCGCSRVTGIRKLFRARRRLLSDWPPTGERRLDSVGAPPVLPQIPIYRPALEALESQEGKKLPSVAHKQGFHPRISK
jgi:hypothetical protein